MDLFRNKFLWSPFVIVIVILLVDRVALYPSLVEMRTTWRKIEPPIYESREELFSILQTRARKKGKKESRIGVIFGSSRSAEFESNQIRNVIGPISSFNFSAPLAPPSFHYYWLERILAAGIRPAYVMLEADPIVTARDSNRYAIAYSYDLPFVLENTSFFRNRERDVWKTEGGFSFDEMETYLLKKIFGFYKYPLDLNAIKENRKKMLLPGKEKHRLVTGLQFRKEMEKTISDANRLKLGGIPNLLRFTRPASGLEKDAEDVMARFGLDDYHADPTQIAFLKRFIRVVAEKKIPLLIYWPISSDPLREKMEQNGSTEEFQKNLVAFINSTREKEPEAFIELVDPQYDASMKCRDFVDSNHLSGGCYANLSKVLFEPIQSRMAD